jgi:hypothetical protein
MAKKNKKDKKKNLIEKIKLKVNKMVKKVAKPSKEVKPSKEIKSKKIDKVKTAKKDLEKNLKKSKKVEKTNNLTGDKIKKELANKKYSMTTKSVPTKSIEELNEIKNQIAQGKLKSAKIATLKATYGPDAIGVCREIGCELLAVAKGYCRLHYLKNWSRIQNKEVILRDGRLKNYIEELVNKYPDKYLEVIRKDLAFENEFAKVIADLEIVESTSDDLIDEDIEITDEIESIKRDFVESEDFEIDDSDF